MPLVNLLGDLSLEATQDKIEADLDERYSGGKSAICATLSASGDNTILTPPAGKSIRLVWISLIPSSDNANSNLCQVKFGGGSPLYIAYALAHWEPFQGAVDAPLIVNTATAEKVSVSAHYRII